MSKRSRKQNLIQNVNEDNKLITKDLRGWDRAAADAETKLKLLEAQAARLKTAIRTFRELAEAGEPFPGGEIVEIPNDHGEASQPQNA